MLHSVGMRLAPGIFMRGDVGGFAKITCTRISAGIRSLVSTQNPVRHAVVNMAVVVVGI